ncbi:hypothetical protein V2G26_017026 [Clonostachys chloroleuca]
MLSEDFLSSVSGPPVAANTAVSKDIGIYSQTLSPSYSIRASFKKSSCARHCLAASDTHVFAAQDQKAHVHVYSRVRGNQEALVPFTERIRSLALSGNVVIVGTIEGRLILWETCTGRQVTTPPCHVQAISCLAVTPHHLLSASDDSNINVWSLAHLLEFDVQSEQEPERVLSNHRGAITDLVTGPSTNQETNICVSSSKDKTCIVWNYRTGQVLRTLLFPATPLCITMDPCARALYVAAEGGALHVVEFFGDKFLLGAGASEPASIVVQVGDPVGVAEDEAGEANCISCSYDGTTILTGHTKGKILRWGLTQPSHPTELANLNASVTNLVFTPLIPAEKQLSSINIMKPNQAQRQYVFNAQLKNELAYESRFTNLLNADGFPPDAIEHATKNFTTATSKFPDDLDADDRLLSMAKQQLQNMGDNSLLAT